MSDSKVYERIIEREKMARKEAEDLLEQKSRELYFLNNELKDLNASLEEKIRIRTEEILKAKEIAEKANSVKSQFLSNISHELRTPLNQITGVAQLMLQANPDSKARERLDIVLKSANTQLEMIDRILKASESDAKAVATGLSVVRKGQLKATEFAFCSFQRKDNVQQNFYFDESLPDEMMLNLSDVEIFIREALENAFRFTDTGVISLSIEKVANDLGDDFNEEKIEISVSDTGIGVPENIRNISNQLFSQGDNSDRRALGGLGLGFSLMHNSARNLGGELSVLAKADVGSVVSLIIPLRVPKAAVVSERKKIRRILIVEDVDVNREIAKAFLEMKGFTVMTARNGLEAVEICKTELNNIDLILMDCQMPVMDGFEASKKIHEIAKLSAPPIYAVTASARESTQMHCLEVGMEEFFTKPVDWNKLAQRIEAA